MVALWDRIDAELSRRGLPWAWLGRKIDASDQAMHNWKGRGVPPSRHKAIADALGWSVDHLLNDRWPTELPPREGVQLEPMSGVLPHIPLQRMRVQITMTARVSAAGGLSLQTEDGGGAVQAAAAGAEAFAIRVQGHALYPAVRNGAYLVCDPQATPAAGDLVLMEAADGALTLRELMAADAEEVTTCDVRGGERETIARAGLRRLVAVVSMIPGSAWRAAS